MIPSRDDALQLLKQYTHSDSLIKHALTVEAVMRHFAGIYGEDPEQWGVIGLVHDLDYEAWPDEHCRKSRMILEEAGWPEEYIRAVVSHGWGICSDVEPVSKLEKVLYTVDELTGLITAAVLVRPSKSILDLQVSSVRKKWKDKGFAAGANRTVIEKGVQMLEADLNEIIGLTIEGMKTAAREIGLEGIPA